MNSKRTVFQVFSQQPQRISKKFAQYVQIIFKRNLRVFKSEMQGPPYWFPWQLIYSAYFPFCHYFSESPIRIPDENPRIQNQNQMEKTVLFSQQGHLQKQSDAKLDCEALDYCVESKIVDAPDNKNQQKGPRASLNQSQIKVTYFDPSAAPAITSDCYGVIQNIEIDRDPQKIIQNQQQNLGNEVMCPENDPNPFIVFKDRRIKKRYKAYISKDINSEECKNSRPRIPKIQGISQLSYPQNELQDTVGRLADAAENRSECVKVQHAANFLGELTAKSNKHN